MRDKKLGSTILIIIMTLSIFISTIIFISTNFSYAYVSSLIGLTIEEPPQNATQNAIDAYQSLLKAEKDMQEMINQNISVNRINDTLIEAIEIYNAQLALEREGKNTNYGLIIERTKKISNLKKIALRIHDGIKAFEIEISILDEGEKNSTAMQEVLEIFEKAKKEFEDERYEEAEKLMEETYKKYNDARAFLTKMRVVYIATTKNIGNLIKNNWKKIMLIIITTIIIGFILQKQIRLLVLQKKLHDLKMEKESIKEQIRIAQKDYFEKKIMPETEYKVRIKKFEELIRDTNRRTALIIKEIEKLKRSKFLLKK